MDNVYDWTNIMDQAMKKKENSVSSGYASSESQEKKGITVSKKDTGIKTNILDNNNILNVADPYESRKSVDHKSGYKETASKGWLRFPFNALRFRRSGKSKYGGDGMTDKSYGKNCKASMRTGLTDHDDGNTNNLFSPISIGRQKSCRSTNNVDTISKGILRGKMRRSFFLSMSSSKSKNNVKSSSHSVKNHY